MSTRPFLTRGVAILALTPTPAAAAEPTSLTGSYSEYEAAAIRSAEARLGARLEPKPEGKTIERLDFVRLDPIDLRDPLPSALNGIHVTSREHAIRPNLFIVEGQRWRGVLVDESARRLRPLSQLSLVVCVPMIGSAPDRVRLVVITKDVWSLYVDFDLAVTSGGLESLTLEPKCLNAQSFLGGESLLRGYPTRYLAGRDLVATNLEYRSRSRDLAASQLGGALFFDAGDAFSGFDHLDPKQSVGGGLRIVFPPIDRAVLRLDVGIPMVDGPRPADVPPLSLFFAFHQAIVLPTIGARP